MIEQIFIINEGKDDYVYSVGEKYFGGEITAIRKSPSEDNCYRMFIDNGKIATIRSNSVMTVGEK